SKAAVSPPLNGPQRIEQFSHGRGYRRPSRFLEGEPDLPGLRGAWRCARHSADDRRDVQGEMGKTVPQKRQAPCAGEPCAQPAPAVIARIGARGNLRETP